MAASQAGRDLLYFTQEENFDTQIRNLVQLLLSKHATVGKTIIFPIAQSN